MTALRFKSVLGHVPDRHVLEHLLGKHTLGHVLGLKKKFQTNFFPEIKSFAFYAKNVLFFLEQRGQHGS